MRDGLKKLIEEIKLIKEELSHYYSTAVTGIIHQIKTGINYLEDFLTKPTMRGANYHQKVRNV